MADRYWVNGTGSWTTSSTTNWSATSGGPSGASVPTATDSVFFNQAGTYTVTMTGALSCLNFNVSAGAVTFTGLGTLAVTGSMSVTNVTPTWSGTGLITFTGSASGKTITTNGISFAAPFTFNGIGGVWTLGSSLTSTSVSAFTITNGTLDTSAVGNYALTIAGPPNIINSVNSILNLNASTVTLSSTLATFGANCILNAGTSTINLTTTTSGYSFAGGGKTFYNVNFTGAHGVTNNTHTISGSNTFNNLSFTGPSVVGITNATFAANQIINGVLSTNGTAGNRRVFFQSSTFSIQWDLFCNSAASLIDANFRDLNIKGTASPISGTRIGDLRGCSGITFSAPKTVYWNKPTGGQWSNDAWATEPGGGVSTDNFPLPQDTAVIVNTGLNLAQAVSIDNAIPHLGSINMSGRTTAMTLNPSFAFTVYGDWTMGSGVTLSGSSTGSFSGRNTQTITSNGIALSFPVVVNSPGGTVELADALGINGTNILTVTNGTFDTKNFNVTVGGLSSDNTNVRTINLGSSTVTLAATSPITFTTSINLTFDAGTSQITCTATSAFFNGAGNTFYNVLFTGSTNATTTLNGANTFNNLSIAAPGGGYRTVTLSANQTINNDISVTGGTTAIRRVVYNSSTIGIPRSLTINGTYSLNDCDFADIFVLGTASPISGTRIGDLKGCSGITFTPTKNVYWNLAAGGSWIVDVAWALSSGGTPDVNNYPLPQDKAIIENTGLNTSAAITISSAAIYHGTIDMSGRTDAMTLNTAFSFSLFGNLFHGSGVTMVGAGTISFIGRTTQRIGSFGRTFTQPININSIGGSVLLFDALTLSATATLTLTLGTFDAVTYNVTVGLFVSSSNTVVRTLKMGSGIWTLSGTGTVLNMGSDATSAPMIYYPGTATIVLSNTSTTARTFAGGSLYYNKLTIGGTTGTSTLSFTGSILTLGELASTKTVAHTIAFGGVQPTIGKWSVTGTLGNVVTVSGTAGIVLSGDRVSGVNYLALGTTNISSTNPVEFYAGVNSTGTGINTAAPAAVTRYWVGGTGSWTNVSTTNWSATSGGTGGASVPTSADTVIFDSASATAGAAYTVTLNAGIGIQVRCAILSMSGTAGGVTFAGSHPLSVTQSFTMASTGVTRTYIGIITFSGTGIGKTIGLGGLVLPNIVIDGIGSEWALASGGTSTNLTVTNGLFDTAGYSLSFNVISTDTRNKVALSLGSSTITSLTSSSQINFTLSSTAINPINLTFDAGTSTISMPGTNVQLFHGGKSFYNVVFGDQTAGFGIPVNGSTLTPTFENLTVWNPGTTGFKDWRPISDIIVNGTLTFTQGTSIPDRRITIFSNTIGTPRTITAGTVVGLNNIDFRDIVCAGTATWGGGTSIGDCGGNSGLTVSTPKTVYWNLVAGGNWSATAWATGSLGTPNINNFPLAQDTTIIENAGLNTSASISLNANWHIGTVDMSTRTNAMTLATSTTNPTIYGDWTFGTGVTASGTGSIIFAKRGTQTITSNGRTFTQPITINSINGIVQLADGLSLSGSAVITLTTGTFDAAIYNVTVAGFISSGNATRTLSMGSGLWTLTGGSLTIWNVVATGLTFDKGAANIIGTGTGTNNISGGGLTYNKFTIAGGTSASSFTINGNNTFSEIASTRTVAYILSLGSTTQTVGAFTVSGSAGNRVTIFGTSVGSFATLIFTGATYANLDYIIPTFLKVYDINSDWYAGTNSINGGSYGWIFTAAPGVTYSAGGLFFVFF